MTILITGARGKVGQGVANRLKAAGYTVRVASAEPSGDDIIELKLNRPETFEAALHGVDQVFLYPEPDGIDAFVKTAEAAGVSHIVLLSSSSVLGPNADTDPLAWHSLAVERALTASNLTCTFLRPDAFASNALGWAYFIGQNMPIQLAYPDANIAPIHPDDIADIAAEALTGEALKGRSITLTGAHSLTFREQLAVISNVLDREIPVEKISHTEAERQMSRYMPAPAVSSLLALWAAASTEPAVIADTTETLLRKPARTFEQWARENAAAF